MNHMLGLEIQRRSPESGKEAQQTASNDMMRSSGWSCRLCASSSSNDLKELAVLLRTSGTD